MADFSLTHKQRTVFEFIEQYFCEHHQSPLIREIQLGCHIASYKSALDRLNALEHKGVIRRLPNKHRGIRLVQRVVDSAFRVEPPATQEVVMGEGAGA